MKRISLLIILLCMIVTAGIAQEKYMQMTTIESVVPGGLGRSRLLTTGPDGYSEEKMENFFSMVGINFKNVVSNDLMISEKLNTLSAEGWELMTITSGVYSADKSTGIFVTRYLFKSGNKTSSETSVE